MVKPVVHIRHLHFTYHGKVIFNDLNWTIARGENWLLSGESGSGKTTLARAIADKKSSEIEVNFDPNSDLPARVVYVENWYQFKNIEGQANFYYQQRYTSLQTKDTHTVNSELNSFGLAHQLDFNELENILIALSFANFKTSTLIELSSGEHKKLQLVKVLWLQPQLLILDQPYTGLDLLSRQNLNQLLDERAAKGAQIIMIANDVELPNCINRFAKIEEGDLTTSDSPTFTRSYVEREKKQLPYFLSEAPQYTTKNLITMNGVNVSYGEKQVLKNISWTVNAGEKWLLQGHNGSGKSTLLSLVNGDHPQAYANDIHLFGRKRGSGESIWDIKKHIGLISPEFHWYFDKSATVWQSIASGLSDSVGLFSTLPEGKKKMVDQLLHFFDLFADKNQLLTALPLGKQRLALLARTVIKNPTLLVLDEPCQGLDDQQTQYFNELIDELAVGGMTLIYVAHTQAQLPSCLTHSLTLNGGTVMHNTLKKEEFVQ